MKSFFWVIPAVALGVGALPAAQTEMTWIQPLSLASGPLSNPTAKLVAKDLGIVIAPKAARVRVVVAEASLGQGSQLRFTSLQDGQIQSLDAAQLEEWSNMSALFNGHRVRVEVILAPGATAVSVRLDQMLAFYDYAAGAEGAGAARRDEFGIETLCGADDRVASNDNPAGRLTGGCTAWLVSNGGVLTAGHCNVVAGAILEVNIPPSLANGTTVASAVQDQFPALAGSITSVNIAIGNDYAVFRVGANNLQQGAHALHGFFRMTPDVPANGATTRVTGCGVDVTPQGTDPTVCVARDTMGNCTHSGPNAQNQTLQTATGPFAGRSGTTLTYSIDTEPANSGSPVITLATGFAIGIHTNGGCTNTGGSNAGTSFALAGLENAIAAVPGANARYVDQVRAPSGMEDGTIFRPHDTLAEGINVVPIGGILSMVTGNYGGAGTTITKAMTIVAPVGQVTFGN